MTGFHRMEKDKMTRSELLRVAARDYIRSRPDAKVLACAFAGKADVIVTGDKKHLLPLKRYRGIPIVSPAEFLEQIG